jgi:dihydroneopterin triphosphate diphosphatase
MPKIQCDIVEVVVFSIEDTVPRYLLLKRSPDDRLYPLIWQFITGGINDGEKAYEAAHREFTEETGLTCKRCVTVPHVNSFYDAKKDMVHSTLIFAVHVTDGTDPALSVEHAEFKWCTLEEAHELLVWPGQRQALSMVHHYVAGGQEAGVLLDITHLVRSRDE